MQSYSEEQKTWFKSHDVMNQNARLDVLSRLEASIRSHEQELYDALRIDLGKHEFEAYTTELALIYQEIEFMKRNLKKLMKDKYVRPYFIVGKKARITHRPKGNVLIIAPFNYPVQLSLVPLVGALAAGNTVILKLSELVSTVNNVLKKIIESVLPSHLVKIVEGDKDVTTNLLRESFDLIFFTGSPRVGKIIMKSASEHLTPVVLELGGKSPAIVIDNANLKIAASKIVWGKCVNVGQTCIAPDYVLVPKDKKIEFIQYCVESIQEFFGESLETNDSYGKVVNTDHANRLRQIITNAGNSVVYGGKVIGTFVEPTIFDGYNPDEEIFGPLLPIVTYSTVQEVLDVVEKHPYPLTAYIFGDEKQAFTLGKKIQTGSVMINDCLMHVAHKHTSFGGIRTSGIGSYHGKQSFDTFSQQIPIVTGWKFQNKLIKPPYNKWYQNINFLRRFF